MHAANFTDFLVSLEFQAYLVAVFFWRMFLRGWSTAGGDHTTTHLRQPLKRNTVGLGVIGDHWNVVFSGCLPETIMDLRPCVDIAVFH